MIFLLDFCAFCLYTRAKALRLKDQRPSVQVKDKVQITTLIFLSFGIRVQGACYNASMPLIQIEWTDAVGGDGWVTLESLQKEAPLTHTSVGFLINETDDFFTITMSVDKNHTNLGAWLLVPKKYVDNFKYL